MHFAHVSPIYSAAKLAGRDTTSMGEYIVVRVEDDETVESMFDLYPSHVSTIQLYLEKEDVDNISIQGNDEMQAHGHIDDNLHTQHYECQQPTGLFTRMLNDDADSTGFYSANERDVRYESYDYTLPTDYNLWSTGYGGGSSQYPFMPITDPSHTFHSASSSRHHVTKEHVIEEDEEDEIDSHDDIDDNENMDEGDDEPLFDISGVNNVEIEYEQDPPDIFTSDQWIDEAMLNNSHEGIDVPCTLEVDIGLHIEVLHCNLHLVAGKVAVHVADAFICIWIRIKKGHHITIVVIVANQDIIEVHVQECNPLIIISMAEMDQLPGPIDTYVLYAQEGHKSQLVYSGQETEVLKYWEHYRSLCGWPVDPLIMHVPDRVLRQFGRVQPILGPVDALDRVTQKGRGHIDWATYFTHFVHMWHGRRDYIIPPNKDTLYTVGRVEYMSWYWSITRRFIGWPGFNYDMHYESRDHIERSLVEGMRHLHMMVSDGLQDDMISNSTDSRYIAIQMYIDSVLSQVQRTDSSTSDAGPLEPCAGSSQQPGDARLFQFSLDVMTFSQHGLYDIGASQILTDEVMPDEITHSQPPQSTVGTYRCQRRHRGSTSTLLQHSQFNLLGETLGMISEDIDSETAQSESCDAILVHETQSQSGTEREPTLVLPFFLHNRVGIANFGVDIPNAYIGVSIANADSDVGICKIDSGVDLANTDTAIVDGTHVDVNLPGVFFYGVTRGPLFPPFLPLLPTTFTPLLLHLFWRSTGARGEVVVHVAAFDRARDRGFRGSTSRGELWGISAIQGSFETLRKAPSGCLALSYSAGEPGRRVRLCPVRAPCGGYEPVSVGLLLHRLSPP
ncbi:hypothetical protein Taro_041783 [Colocasia esculenta]|uniref:Uncharacterized protein n=1 Tax=Colocasia esculenta TaxID=4460 RepID=A0A843WQW7_COLES|nr:hypothetical protein [Colocasia esculenta]